MNNSITCPHCGMTSYNPNDVSRRYCGNCRQYHDIFYLHRDMIADAEAVGNPIVGDQKTLRTVLQMVFPRMSDNAKIVTTEQNPITIIGERILIPHHTIIDADTGRIFDINALHLELGGAEYVFVLLIEVDGMTASMTISARPEDQ